MRAALVLNEMFLLRPPPPPIKYHAWLTSSIHHDIFWLWICVRKKLECNFCFLNILHILDFYEEVMSLIFSMTCTHISPPLWQVFEMLYATFEQDGYDYFVGKFKSFIQSAVFLTGALTNIVTTSCGIPGLLLPWSLPWCP